jgi:DNA-binding NarL/FixJ family response regulator
MKVAERLEQRVAADRTGPEPTAGGLTLREVEVLRLVAEGRTDQEIADALFVARRTVTSHVSNILAKLDAETRAAAAVDAVRRGLI